MGWLKIELTASEEEIEPLADFLMELGAEGIYEQLPLGSEGVSLPGERHTITAYLPSDGEHAEQTARLNSYLKNLSLISLGEREIGLQVELIEKADWSEEWKNYFRPFRVGKRIVIKPTWETFAPGEDDLLITIDPGMAFGTGQHHTTQMCLCALETILAAPGGSGDWRVLDVGTGTGILAIAAAKLGAKEVTAVDVDTGALAIARENVRQNGVEDRVEISDKSLEKVKPPYDLIVANLTLPLLQEMAPSFLDLLSPRGYLVISGFLSQDQKQMKEVFCSSPWMEVMELRQEDWLCFVCQKDGSR